MTPEQRHDKIKHRRAQIARLEKKAKALNTRIKKARRSLKALERVQATLGVDAARIEREREEAAGLAGLERYMGKPKKPKRELPTHFVFHGDDRYWRGHAGHFGHAKSIKVRRTVCGTYVALTEGRAMRVGTVVTCPKCTAVQKAWLAQTKRKPLTLRRAKALRVALANTERCTHGEGGKPSPGCSCWLTGGQPAD